MANKLTRSLATEAELEGLQVLRSLSRQGVTHQRFADYPTQRFTYGDRSNICPTPFPERD
jgi:hypothetical protein